MLSRKGGTYMKQDLLLLSQIQMVVKLKAFYAKVLHSDSLRVATIYIMCKNKAGG